MEGGGWAHLLRREPRIALLIERGRVVTHGRRQLGTCGPERARGDEGALLAVAADGVEDGELDAEGDGVARQLETVACGGGAGGAPTAERTWEVRGPSICRSWMLPLDRDSHPYHNDVHPHYTRF